MQHRRVDAAVEHALLDHRHFAAEHVMHGKLYFAGVWEFEGKGRDCGEGIGMVLSHFDGGGDDAVEE
jgi:hypothetical protein